MLHTESFGRQKMAALRLPAAEARRLAAGADLDVEPVNLQKAFVYLVGEHEREEASA